MNKRAYLFLLRLWCCFLLAAGIVFFFTGTGVAYVLQGPHILDLAVKNMVEPAGLVVQQQKTVLKNVHSGDFPGKMSPFPDPDDTPDIQSSDGFGNTFEGVKDTSKDENAQIFNLKE